MSRPTAKELLNESKTIRYWLSKSGVRAVDLDEVTADVIAATWESIERGHFQIFPGVKPRTALLAYMQGVTWHRAHAFLKRAYRRHELLFEQVPDDSTATPDARIIARDELTILDGLKPERRDVLLAHAAGCNVGEIAEATGVCVNTVWSRLRLGRRDLLAALRRRAARER
jgi:RNA polymerase sigma-70 factor (ECF subfamily)